MAVIKGLRVLDSTRAPSQTRTWESNPPDRSSDVLWAPRAFRKIPETFVILRQSATKILQNARRTSNKVKHPDVFFRSWFMICSCSFWSPARVQTNTYDAVITAERHLVSTCLVACHKCDVLTNCNEEWDVLKKQELIQVWRKFVLKMRSPRK